MPGKFCEIREAYANQSPQAVQIADNLVMYSDQYLESIRYQHALPILLAYGKKYKARPYVYPLHAEPKDRCYDKAYEFAMRDRDNLFYCEGFLCYKGHEKVLAHGWCMTKTGRIVDPTLYAHQHLDVLTYYGVPLNLDYVTRWHEQHGYVGLLDGHMDGLPIGVHYDSPDEWLELVEWRSNDE